MKFQRNRMVNAIMNEFIKLRKEFYEDSNPYVFPLAFLGHYVDTNKEIDSKEYELINKIQTINKIEFDDNLEGNPYRILSFLGDEKHLDSYIVNLILKKYKKLTKAALEKAIKTIFYEDLKDDIKIYHLLDICIECDIALLVKEDIDSLLKEYKTNFDIVSIVLEYLHKFDLLEFMEDVYSLLEEKYPDSIKLQILDLIVNFKGENYIDKIKNDKKIKANIGEGLLENYINLNKKIFDKNEGISIMQSMFYGDFEDSGKGNNGGLAIGKATLF